MSVKIMGMVWENGPRLAARRLMLLAIADNSDDYGVAWPSTERLAEKCCTDRRGAQRTLRALEQDGWIRTFTGGGTRGKNGPGIPNRYQINLSMLAPTAVDEPPLNEEVYCGSTDPHCGSTDALNAVQEPQEPSVEPSKNHHVPNVTQIEEDFSDFYSQYPKKKDPGAARRAYRAARKRGATHEQIIYGLTAQLPDMERRRLDGERRGGDFRQNPSTWLNADAWINEVSDAEKPYVNEWDVTYG